MPFKIAPNATFTHDVTVMVPKDGGFEADKLRTTFNYVERDEVDTFDLKTVKGTLAFLKRVVVRFHDLVDDKGASVPDSDELRDSLIRNRLEVRVALSEHWFGAVAKVKEGN